MERPSLIRAGPQSPAAAVLELMFGLTTIVWLQDTFGGLGNNPRINDVLVVVGGTSGYLLALFYFTHGHIMAAGRESSIHYLKRVVLCTFLTCLIAIGIFTYSVHYKPESTIGSFFVGLSGVLALLVALIAEEKAIRNQEAWYT